MLTVGLYGIRDTTSGDGPTYTHDHSVAFMRNGRVEDVVSLERLTRRKHDNRLDHHFFEILRGRVADEPVRFVSVNSFVGDAFQTADGNFRIEPTASVGVDSALVSARVRWWPDGLHQRVADGWALCHEFAHVASLLPFVGRFEPNSLLVHVDGGASNSACSAWWWDGATARLIDASWDRLKVPVNNFNTGPIARLALDAQARDQLSIPGKFMGFAGHGHADASHRAWLVDHQFFLDVPLQAVEVALAARFGHSPPYADLAATTQAYFEDEVSSAILAWGNATGAKHLYYAGGAALNIPTNARLEASGAFKSVHVPPCTNDTGLALGAAAWVELQAHGHVEQHGPYLSRSGSTPADLGQVDEIAHRIAAGEVLGLCIGDAEVGPRALGHRSIVARPDDPSIRRRVSETIKRREWYRPVAPMMLESIAYEAFGEAVTQSNLSGFMLGAWPLRAEWGAKFAGVVHADGSLRAQVVRDDRFLDALLRRLWDAYGIAGLINTSFNGPGEPIVHTHRDAIDCSRRLGLDGVVLDGSLHRT